MTAARHRCSSLLMAKDQFTSYIPTSRYDNIAVKFGTEVDVQEVVTWEKFDLQNLRGVNFTEG